MVSNIPNGGIDAKAFLKGTDFALSLTTACGQVTSACLFKRMACQALRYRLHAKKTTDGPDGSGGGLLGSRSGRERTIAWKLSCLPMDEPGSCCLRFLQEISLSLMPGQHAKPSSLKKLPRKSLLFDRRQTQLLQLNCSRQACECNMVQVSSALFECSVPAATQRPGLAALGVARCLGFRFCRDEL